MSASIRRIAKERLSANGAFIFAYNNAIRLAASFDVPLANGAVVVDPVAAYRIIENNRTSLSKIDTWIDEAALSLSPFKYGILDFHRKAIDIVPDKTRNLTDYICYFASKTQRLSYLEIGLSVGRNFWQVLNSCKGANLTGYDMDNLYPIVRNKLKWISCHIIQSNHASARKTLPQKEVFHHDETDNSVSIVSGDVFDDAVWDTNRGQRFNLVFSDALHTPDAIIHEWKKLQQLELLNKDGFTMVWDDLSTRDMRRAFGSICKEAINNLGVSSKQCAFLQAPGWIGQGELPHGVGVISTNGFVA